MNDLNTKAGAESFAVSYSKGIAITLWCLCGFFFSLILLMTIALLRGSDGETADIIAIWVLFAVLFCPIILPFALFIFRMQGLKIGVQGDTLDIKTAFGKSRTVNFKDITRVKMKFLGFLSNDGIVNGAIAEMSAPNIMVAYIGKKKLFKVNRSYKGFDLLEQRIKKANIPIGR